MPKSFRHRRRRVNNREIVIVFQADRPTTRRLAVYDAGIKMGICSVCRRGRVQANRGVSLSRRWGTHLHAARKNSRDQLSVPALENQSLRPGSSIIHTVQMTKEGCATKVSNFALIKPRIRARTSRSVLNSIDVQKSPPAPSSSKSLIPHSTLTSIISVERGRPQVITLSQKRSILINRETIEIQRRKNNEATSLDESRNFMFPARNSHSLWHSRFLSTLVLFFVIRA